MCHIFFIQPIIDGHLGWFQVFAIVHSYKKHTCASLYSRMIYNPLGVYPVRALLGQMLFLVLDPWGIAILSSTMVELIYTSVNHVWVSISPQPHQHLFPDFLIIAILTGVRSYLIVILICISLMISEDELFFICSLAAKCLLLGSVCSYPLPTFNGVVYFFLGNLFKFLVDSSY